MSDGITILNAGGRQYGCCTLAPTEQEAQRLHRLPYCLRILLENLVRRAAEGAVRPEDVEAVRNWDPHASPSHEIAFMPARVLLQDFTGVPCLVDLAAMRDAVAARGRDPETVNPLLPVELVIDHSVQVDFHGSPDAFERNVELEFRRNRERYAFLKWGQTAFRGLKVVPPSTGIVHQVNLERLARVVCVDDTRTPPILYPDTVVGTDSHTTMVNGLGVLGWGVGGIEAEAAMLGQPIPMLIPQVVGVRLTGRLAAGVTATDLVLCITQMLRRHGVVGKFVEFTGPGASALPLPDRATIANMAPEYGATCGFFPVDDATLRYLRETGRPAEHVALVEACTRALGLYRRPDDPEPQYSETLELDLGSVRPSAAGPRRPQDRVDLQEVTVSFAKALPDLRRTDAPNRSRTNALGMLDGAVVIAAITSCTNTSNPSVMMAAGLLAKKAAERGLKPPKWVKASLAPGSRVVTEYLRAAGLLEPLGQLGFHLVGYGCTTCIGNSGPLLQEVSEAIEKDGLVVAAVLSGNRNFEGRVQQEVRANYLASPPLVVAYALAGSVAVNLTRQPLGIDRDGRPVMLEEIWPSAEEVAEAVERYVKADLFADCYASIFDGDANWRAIPDSGGALYSWDPNSTYIKRPPYFENMPMEPPSVVDDIRNARVLLLLGDSVTTDHISPAGGIRPQSPAGRWLMERGVKPEGFNSYGSRRGHDEVMVRGAFANVRLRNRLTPETEGGLTVHIPTDEVMSVYDAAMRYRADGTPLLIIAGKEYGSGSSRDWAAKGPYLLGVRAVLAESFERIHRSNLIGMGVAPLQFRSGESANGFGLTGRERYSVFGIESALRGATEAERLVEIVAEQDGGPAIRFRALLRIDTPQEADYFRHGGILPYVLRQLMGKRS